METREVLLSGKDSPKCVSCASPSPRRMPAEDIHHGCSVQTPMLGQEGQLACCECVQTQPCEDQSKRRCDQRNATPCVARERDCLLSASQCSLDTSMVRIQDSTELPGDSLVIYSCASDQEDSADTRSSCKVFPGLHDTEETSRHIGGSDCEGYLGRVSIASSYHPDAISSSPFLPSHSPPPSHPTDDPHRSHHSPSLPPSPEASPSIHSSIPGPSRSDTRNVCCENQSNLLALNSAASHERWLFGEEAAEQFVIVNEGAPSLCHSARSSEGAVCLDPCTYIEPKDSTVLSMTSFTSLTSDGPMCRICHEGALSNEDLIAPCHCSGTLSFQHRKCLEQWLQTRGKDACELCDFHFQTEHKGRPFTEWIRQPERIRDRRNILTDCGCFTLLTPLVCVSTWLCLNGAYHYLNYYEGRGWEGIGLVSLATVLILIYLFWSLMSLRYHCTVWRTWRLEHQRVHVVMPTKGMHLSKASNLEGEGERSSHQHLSTPNSCSSCSGHSVSPGSVQTNPARV